MPQHAHPVQLVDTQYQGRLSLRQVYVYCVHQELTKMILAPRSAKVALLVNIQRLVKDRSPPQCASNVVLVNTKMKKAQLHVTSVLQVDFLIPEKDKYQ